MRNAVQSHSRPLGHELDEDLVEGLNDDLSLPLDGFVRLRRTTRHNRWRSVRITFFKWSLLVLAIAGLGSLMFWPSHLPQPSKTAELALKAAPEGLMEFPRFAGTDSHDQPYELVALASKQSILPEGSKDAPPIELVLPQAEMTMRSGMDAAFTSQGGNFDQKGQRLKLVGNVVFGYGNGQDQAYMPEIDIDMTKNFAWTDKPVTLTGSFGRIDGVGLQIYDGGAVVVIPGKAHAVLNGASQPSSSGSAKAKAQTSPAL